MVEISAFTAYSQQFEWAGPGYQVSKYLFTQNKSHIIIRDSNIIAIDSSGDYKWWGMTWGDNVKVYDVLELPDTSYVYIYRQDADVFYNYFWERYNSNWESPYLDISAVPFSIFRSENVAGIALDSVSFLIYQKGIDPLSCPGRIHKASGSGSSGTTWMKQYEGYLFKDATVLNGQIIFCTNQGLLLLNNEGDIVSQYDSFNFDRIKNFDDSSLLVQKADTIVRLSPNFEPIDTLILTNGHIQDFDGRSGHIGLLVSNQQYIIYDGQFNEIDNFFPANPGLQYTFTQLGDTSVFLAGNTILGQAPYLTDAVFIKEYGLNGAEAAPEKDIGVVNVSFGQVTVNHNPPGYYQVIFHSVRVIVKNFGNVPVKGFFISSGYKYPSTTADFISYQSRQYYHSIWPDATMEIILENLYLRFNEYPPGLFNLCLWSSLPGNGFDVNTINDAGCVDFLVNTIDIASVMNISVYPNPAHDYLQVELPAPFSIPATWSLYTATGQQVLQHKLPAGQVGYTLSLAGVPPGLYFWEVRSEGRRLGSGKLAVTE